MSFMNRLKHLPHKGGILGTLLMTTALIVGLVVSSLWIPAVIMGAVGLGVVVGSGVRTYYHRKKAARDAASHAPLVSASTAVSENTPEVEEVLGRIRAFKVRFTQARTQLSERGVPELLGLAANVEISDCIRACKKLMLYWNQDKTRGIAALYARDTSDPDRQAVHTIVEFVRTLHSELQTARDWPQPLCHLPCWQADKDAAEWDELLRGYDPIIASLANTQKGYRDLMTFHRGLMGQAEPQPVLKTVDPHVMQTVSWERPLACGRTARAQYRLTCRQIAEIERLQIESRALGHQYIAFVEEDIRQSKERTRQAQEEIRQAEERFNMGLEEYSQLQWERGGIIDLPADIRKRFDLKFFRAEKTVDAENTVSAADKVALGI